MIRCVLFDLDGTLYDFDAATARALDSASAVAERHLGIPAADLTADYFRILDEQRSENSETAGYHSRLIRFQRMLEERDLPLRFATRLSDAYWDGFLRDIEPFPGLVPALDALRADGVRIGLGTNMSAEWQFRKLERMGMIDLFHFVVTSEEAASEKPAPRFFAFCERKARCAASECLFIGDNLPMDVLGAMGAGMRAAWFQPDAAERGKHAEVCSFGSYADLVSLVKGDA